jgi:hypothetical protein
VWVGAETIPDRRVMSGRKSWPAPDPSHVWVGLGLVGLRVFSYNFQVGSSYFLVWVKISARARPVTRSGQVFSGGSGRVYQVIAETIHTGDRKKSPSPPLGRF